MSRLTAFLFIAIATVVPGCNQARERTSTKPSETSPPTTVASSQTVPEGPFEIGRPYTGGFCLFSRPPICNDADAMYDLMQLGYRMPTEIMPDPQERDENYWLSLSPLEKSDYLSYALWNYITRIGVSGGMQSFSEQDIQDEYDWVIDTTKTLVGNLKSGYPVVGELVALREVLRENDDPEWIDEWRMHAVIFYALPAIEPSLISEVDSQILYTN